MESRRPIRARIRARPSTPAAGSGTLAPARGRSFGPHRATGATRLLSAALATWSTPRRAILLLVVGGFFIFPLTQFLLRLMHRPASLPPGHPFNGLAMQVAFTLPLGLPLVGAAALHRLDWLTRRS